jgi:hypothetical protein
MPTAGAYPSSPRARERSASVRRTSPSRGGSWIGSGETPIRSAINRRTSLTVVGSAPPPMLNARPSAVLVGARGEQVRVDDIVDVGEVTCLRPVSVDDGSRTREAREGEPGNDCGVLAGWILPGTIDVEIAKADRRNIHRQREGATVGLAGKLARGVG